MDRWVWESFQNLKELLTSTFIIALREEGVTFVVFCESYHLGKENMVEDALSGKAPSMGILDFLKE